MRYTEMCVASSLNISRKENYETFIQFVKNIRIMSEHTSNLLFHQKHSVNGIIMSSSLKNNSIIWDRKS